MSNIPVVFLGGALLLCCAPVRAEVSSRVGDLPFPGGVADAAGDSAYVDAATGGVEAIALDGGGVRWRALGVARPIAVAGKRVVMLSPTSRRNELRLAVADATTGKIERTSQSFSLPGWVSIPPARQQSFACSATVDGERVVVYWHATAAWSQGMHPDEEQERAAQHEAAGAVEFALDSGKAHALTDAAPKATGRPSLPPVVVERHRGPRMETRDGHHVLIEEGGRWGVFSAPSGKKVGDFSVGGKLSDAVVIGSRIYLERGEPRRHVQAIDLKSGSTAWERPLAAPPTFPPLP